MKVQLPDNEATLAAYTIPDEKTTNSHYNYVWTLVDQSKGGFTGIVISKTLKLSQLIFQYFNQMFCQQNRFVSPSKILSIDIHSVNPDSSNK